MLSAGKQAHIIRHRTPADHEAPPVAGNYSTRRFDIMMDEGTPDAPADDEDSVGKGLKLQLFIIGGIVLLVVVAVFFGAI